MPNEHEGRAMNLEQWSVEKLLLSAGPTALVVVYMLKFIQSLDTNFVPDFWVVLFILVSI